MNCEKTGTRESSNGLQPRPRSRLVRPRLRRLRPRHTSHANPKCSHLTVRQLRSDLHGNESDSTTATRETKIRSGNRRVAAPDFQQAALHSPRFLVFTKRSNMLQRLRLVLLASPLRTRAISTSETVKPAFLAYRRPIFSAFRSPTSAWKDRLRLQALAQLQRRQRSPFVQQQYQRFIKQHPELTSSRRPIHGRYFAPGIKPPVKLQALPKPSYLKARLLKQNDPHATARRNSLLQSQPSQLPRPKITRLRVPRRHSHRKVNLLKKLQLQPRRSQGSACVVRVAAPRRVRVVCVKRFSRRRQI